MKMVLSTWREGRWPIQSMLWVNRDVEAEQVPIESPDLIVVIIWLPEWLILMVLVYVLGGDTQALYNTYNYLCKVITEVRQKAGIVVEVIIIGDFNQHDQLWGGDDISLERQGKVDPIINLMNEFALSSLLKQGTKIWHGRGYGGDLESTIDLVLTSKNLIDSMVKCMIHGTEHGSNHSIIKIVFDVLTPGLKYQE
jgi:hypothetical protein